MSRFWHILSQVLLIGAQVGAAYVNGGKLGAINAGLAVGQAALGVGAQSFNTDGTPQTKPFVKPFESPAGK